MTKENNFSSTLETVTRGRPTASHSQLLAHLKQLILRLSRTTSKKAHLLLSSLPEYALLILTSPAIQIS